MSLRRWIGAALVCPAFAGALLLGLSAGPATAQSALLPPDFFNKLPKPNADAAVIEANTLSYDGDTKIISAEGDVVLKNNGITLKGDKLVYHQGGGNMTMVGSVDIVDADGMHYTANTLDVTGGMKNAVLQSMTLVTPGGTRITADDTHYGSGLETILNNATYSPCGDCIDAKGHRIGWQVKAAKVTYNSQTKMVYLEQPRLELLGIPLAWAPYMQFPDPSERMSRLMMPSFGYTEKNGAFLSVPYYMAIDQDTDLLLTPTLFSRQGLLFAFDWTHRFTGGQIDVNGSGIKQMDPSAYEGDPARPQAGDRDWRGSLQTSGYFTPVKSWEVGWSYTAFSDPNYLKNYDMTDSDSVVNEVYATHLDKNNYIDVRVQKFNILDDDAPRNPAVDPEDKQALLIPNARYNGVLTLDDGLSQVGFKARLIGLNRNADDTASGCVIKPANGASCPTADRIPYVYGYEGTKVHGMVEAGWQRQWIGPGGLLATPYLGVRGDAAYYDGRSTLHDDNSLYPDNPNAATIFSLTPIAALDLRWPLLIADGADSHIVEPIAQVVYRGSNVSTPGITNDDAQSFVLDDTNLFSYDRFSGTDRQETGLRANVGLRYQANFADGSWLELLAGESFHLAGTNSLGIVDATQVGNYSGAEDTASYVVLGAKGRFWNLINAAAKSEIDPYSGDVVRAGFTGGVAWNGYNLNLNYIYLAPNEDLGVVDEQHEIGAVASAPLPILDYWRVTAGIYWDLRTNQWLQVQGGLAYDDGYLGYGATISKTGPTAETPDDLRILFNFHLKGPDGADFALSQKF